MQTKEKKDEINISRHDSLMVQKSTLKWEIRIFQKSNQNMFRNAEFCQLVCQQQNVQWSTSGIHIYIYMLDSERLQSKMKKTASTSSSFVFSASSNAAFSAYKTRSEMNLGSSSQWNLARIKKTIITPTSLCLPHVSSANLLAYSGSSQTRMLSNRVPDLTWAA